MRLVMSARSRLRPSWLKMYASLRFIVPSSMPAMVCSVITMRFRNSKRVRLLMPVARSCVNSAKNWLSSSQASVGRISRSVRAFSRADCSDEQIEPGLALSAMRKATTSRSSPRVALPSNCLSNSARLPEMSTSGSQPGAMPPGRSSSRLVFTPMMRAVFSARSR